MSSKPFGFSSLEFRLTLAFWRFDRVHESVAALKEMLRPFASPQQISGEMQEVCCALLNDVLDSVKRVDKDDAESVMEILSEKVPLNDCSDR